LRSDDGLSHGAQRRKTQSWPMPPGLVAARICTGSPAADRPRLIMYTYCFSVNVVSSSKPMNWYSADW